MILCSSRALLLVLLTHRSTVDSLDHCGDQPSDTCTTVANPEVDAQRESVLLQVTMKGESAPSQLHNLSHDQSHDSHITFTTTLAPAIIAEDALHGHIPRPVDIKRTEPVRHDVPRPVDIKRTEPVRHDVPRPDMKLSKPVPHDPHANMWYWPWSRPANGNFEFGTPGEIPPHWQRFGSHGHSGLLSTSQARSGTSSVWFSGHGWELIETGSEANERLMVTTNSNYTATFWARSTNADQNIQTMFSVYEDPFEPKLSRNLVTSNGYAQKFHSVAAANTWQKFTHSFTAGEWTNKVRMNMGPNGASGSLWIDDVLFSRDA